MGCPPTPDNLFEKRLSKNFMIGITMKNKICEWKTKICEWYKIKHEKSPLWTSVVTGFFVMFIASGIIFVGLTLAGVRANRVQSTSIVMGVFALGGSAVVQYRKQKFTEEETKINREKLDEEKKKNEASLALEQDMQFANRMQKAIEHLGDKNPYIAYGGLFELLRLADDSKKDRSNAFSIIKEYINVLAQTAEKASSDNQTEADNHYMRCKQAVANFIRKQVQGFFDGVVFDGLDLSHTILWDVELNVISWNNALLSGAQLNHAKFSFAELNFANFNNANLNFAKLNDAYLIGAELNDAELYNANFFNSELYDTNLRGINATDHDGIKQPPSYIASLFKNATIKEGCKFDPDVLLELVKFRPDDLPQEYKDQAKEIQDKRNTP